VEQDPELLSQVVTILQAFFRTSLDWTGGDNDLEFKRSKLSLVILIIYWQIIY
jgi:hypothetical protein